MAKAKKLPSGSWRVNQYVGINPTNGKRAYKSFTAETKKEAEFLAAQYALTQKDVVRSSKTLGVAMKAYIENKSAILSPSTIVGYNQLYRNAYNGILPVKLSAVTNDLLQRAINEYAKSHSPKSTRNASGFLSAVLAEYAPDFRYCIKLPQKDKAQIFIPQNDQIKSLLDQSEGTPMHLVYVLASVLGLRRSEISALCWSDVDFEKNTLSITKAMVINDDKEWVMKSPKSYAGARTLSLPQIVRNCLEEQPEHSRNELIVPYTPNGIYKRFYKHRNNLGIEFRFHDLRHYTASVMLALGVPDKYAMERMGHATPNMLKTVYQHTMEEKQAEISARMNDFFNDL